ncbi:hypothetical protein PIB19_06305 [Sphingomonas sp. 7/4-4]|nr:hypothetical protein [Sphingomonas sp. 7/4-4]WBY08998.1 hypothetical protein PIB19_06305 [Sphingomonas sp. 7/4-4]
MDPDGTLVMGGWVVEGLTGAFDMTREKFDAEALEGEEDIAIVIGRGA